VPGMHKSMSLSGRGVEILYDGSLYLCVFTVLRVSSHLEF
jgi:hypothetical protein